MQDVHAMRRLWQAIFWISFPFGFLTFVLPIYGDELGASALQIGALFSAFALVPVVVRPFLGRALDRWGRRPFLLIGLIGYLLAMAVFALADKVWLLTLGRFIQGLGQAFLWLTALTIVADLAVTTGRGLSFGSIDEATNRGAIIGTSLGFTGLFWIQGSQNVGIRQYWPVLFAAFTLPAFLAVLIAWRGIPETRPASVDQSIQNRPLSHQLLALMGIVFVTGASSAMVWPLLMIFLKDSLGAGVAELALAYLPAALISAILPSRTGSLADRFGRKPLMVMGLLVGALASALIPHLRTITFLAILWAIESVGYAASMPAERAFVADIAGEDARGTSYGLYTFAFFLGAFFGPLAGGWLYDNIHPSTPFYLNSLVLTLGAALVWAFLGARPAWMRPGPLTGVPSAKVK
jgi:DHA1 family multidrug resistance protein-like MFS transporter